MENIIENHKDASPNHASLENNEMHRYDTASDALNISERLRFIRIKLELSQSEAASKFEIPLGSWKKYEAGPSEPGSGALRCLAAGGINTNWLLTGEGEMLLSDKYAQDQRTHYHARSFDLDMPDESRDPAILDDFALVPVYDVQASAGHGSLVESEPKTGHLAFRRDWIRSKGLEIKHLAIITAKGDSMEPTISDGDILLIDTSVDKIIDDTLYIVQAEHHLRVKRIQQAIDGTLIIISDNQRYEKQIISPEQAKEIKIAGRVRWYGHEI